MKRRVAVATSVRNAGWTRKLWLLPLLFVLSACLDHHEWHQKQTVVVDTPSGEESDTSVVQVKAAFGQQLLSQNEVWYKVIGEATVVELAPGQYLFALLGRDEERYYRAVRDHISTPYRGEWLKLIPAMDEVAVLKPDNYPMLVTFGDINDPKTVREVDPENLADSFGPGFSLNRITLEITREPTTRGRISALLGWWLIQAKGIKDPPAFRVPDQSPRGYRNVGVNSFLRGIEWRQE